MMNRFIRFLGILILPLGVISHAPAQEILDLSWSSWSANRAFLYATNGGKLTLDGTLGQAETGELGSEAAEPLTLWGGFLAPLDPTLQLLSPRDPQIWRIGETARIHWWTDVPVAGQTVRIELWRGPQMLAMLGHDHAPTGDHVFTFKVPQVPPGVGCRLRLVSTLLEWRGNPNDTVESGPILTLTIPSAVEQRHWALFE